MILAKFRQLYPQGSLVGELIDIDRGTYIVRVSAIVDNITLATGLAGRDTVETAEDAARERAIAILMLDSQNRTPSLPKQEVIKTKEIASSPSDEPQYSTVVTESNFKPEIQPEVTSPPEQLPPQSPTESSNNLFAGTYNPDSMLENIPESEEDSPEMTSSKKPELAQSDRLEEFNFNEIKHKTDLEIKRLGWTQHDGKEFLKSRYGKPSRLHLTDQQLLEFLQYLENQPNPS